ncbi:hypothetical protein [Gynuella sp.]|uniref:hypothetical protein n=1 Tax=Gynuella sp. TaxID=2969146 RepID=UPI003D1114F8
MQSENRVESDLTLKDTAKYLYFGHHEGLAGAKAILPTATEKNPSLTDDRAKTLFSWNASATTQKSYLTNNNNDYSTAYISWLNDYTDKHVDPSKFEVKK